MKGVRHLMRKKAYRAFFASFICTFLLPAAVLVAALLKLSSTLEREAAMSSQLVLEQFRSGLDSQLFAATRMADSLLLDDKALYLAERDDPMQTLSNVSSFQMLKNMTRQVSLLPIAYTDIAQCYLYLPKSDMVLSNTITGAADFYQRRLSHAFSSESDWRALLLEDDGFCRVNSAVYYIRTLLRGDTRVLTVALELDSAQFDAHARLLREEPVIDRDVAVFSSDNAPLFFARGEPPALVEGMATDAFGALSIIIDGVPQRAEWSRSEQTGCLYLMTTPEATYGKRLRIVQTAIALGGAALLALGLGLSFWLARRQYRPILALRGFIDRGAGDGQTDDFGYLSEMFRAINAERNTAAEQVRDSAERIETFALERLLKGMYASPAAMEEQLLSVNIAFDAESFAVVGVRLDGFDGAQALGAEDRKLIRFVIVNVLEEQLAQYGARAAACDGIVWAVCCLPEAAPWKEALSASIDAGAAFLRAHFGFLLTVAADSAPDGLRGIHHAYLGALRLLRDAEGRKEQRLLFPPAQAEPALPGALPSPQAEAQQLARRLLEGDADDAMLKLSDIHARQAELPQHLARLRWCALVQALLPLIPVRTDEARRLIDQRVHAFVNAPPLSDEYAQVRSLCGFISGLSQAEEEGRDDLARRVALYIEESYASDALSVTRIAEHLSLSPGYASAQYKKLTGETMLDAINSVRLRHAKALLSETALSAEEIAARVGYYSSSTFLRAFRRYEGVTPGQYRAMTRRVLDGASHEKSV